MGRPVSPPRLRVKHGRYTVRFTLAGRQYERSTRTADPNLAERIAADIYNEASANEEDELPPAKADGPGVYAAISGSHVKIGCAKTSIARRLDAIQTCSPHPIEFAILSTNPSDEVKFHKIFGSHHVRGEWFFWNDETKALVAEYRLGVV